jgi:hypothetical protein
MNLEHTCKTYGKACNVARKWFAKVSEKGTRIDPKTRVETMIETTKGKYGVDISKGDGI